MIQNIGLLLWLRLYKCIGQAMKQICVTQDTLGIQSYRHCDRHRPFVLHHIHIIIFLFVDGNINSFLPSISDEFSWFGDYKAWFMIEGNQKNQNMFETIINPQKGVKTFVFQRQQTQQSQIVDYQVDLRQNFINLNHLLSIYCPAPTHRVSIYDPNSNKFITLTKLGAENGFLHRQYLQPRVVLLRYRKNTVFAVDSEGVDSSMEADSQQERKEGRSKERTIGQAIELVKKWRNLHLHGHSSINRRLNLQDAAKLIGISKKSLDDYYCQLRLGQFYNFDFYNKLHEKMGVLRSFVKDYKPEKDAKKRQNQKHPKNLRVIEQYSLETKQLQKVDFESQSVAQNHQQQQQQSNQHQEPFMEQKYSEMIEESNPLLEQLSQLQNNFFRGFQMFLDQPIDPYKDINRDFSKKDFEDESMSFIYF